jgi:hypothetical protein
MSAPSSFQIKGAEERLRLVAAPSEHMEDRDPSLIAAHNLAVG